MNKKCPKCASVSTKKDGKRNGRQSYRCKECGHVFQNAGRNRKEDAERLFDLYAYRKHTLAELAGDT